MAAKITGISPELLIHPGETILDILEERGISQVDLATITGVSPAYVSNVLAGKKDISAKFACALEYALGVPKSFWLNLQANYDAQLLELNEYQTITDEESVARDSLKEVVKFLRDGGQMPSHETREDSIISLRKALRISNLANLKQLIPNAIFHLDMHLNINPYILGAWIRLCQLNGEKHSMNIGFDAKKTGELISSLKMIITSKSKDVFIQIQNTLAQYGIDFSVAKRFKGAPVSGYVAPKSDGSIQLVLTVEDSNAYTFWFSLFHELGHVVNGDVSRQSRFVDDGVNEARERAADSFALRHLLGGVDYQAFVDGHDYRIESIERYAHSQSIEPYLVIAKLQQDKHLSFKDHDNSNPRYQWLEEKMP